MKVRVYTDYSPIKIVSGVDLDKVSLSVGLVGAFIDVDDSTLPPDRTDRDLWKVVDGAVVVGEQSQEYIISKFNAETAIGREAQVFSASDLIRLMPYSYTLNELIRFKNFWGGDGYDGLKQVLTGLVAGGQILQSDYDKLASILLEQGVVL